MDGLTAVLCSRNALAAGPAWADCIFACRWMWTASDGRSLDGWEHVEAAYECGKGVVFATGHIGNWVMAGAVFAARGHPVMYPVVDIVEVGAG